MKLSEAAKKKDAEESRIRSRWAYKIIVTRGRRGADNPQEWVVSESDLAPNDENDAVGFKSWIAAGELTDALEETAGWNPEVTYACDILEHLAQAIDTARQGGVQQNKVMRAQKRCDEMYLEVRKHMDTIKRIDE